MIDVDRAQFERLVQEGLDEVPAQMLDLLDNVAFLVEDEPDPVELEMPPNEAVDLLGIYLGVPLPERDGGWAGALPDRIFLFRGPLTRMCDSLEELREEITVTIVHEAAHHVGIDEERLHELGWG